jgi:hypothetical protein
MAVRRILAAAVACAIASSGSGAVDALREEAQYVLSASCVTGCEAAAGDQQEAYIVTVVRSWRVAGLPDGAQRIVAVDVDAVAAWPQGSGAHSPSAVAAADGVVQLWNLVPGWRDGWRRAAVTLAVPADTPVGSFSAASATRPTQAELEAAAIVASALLGDGAVLPAGNRSAVTAGHALDTLDLARAAIHAPAALSRTGQLSQLAWHDNDTAVYSPLSTREQVASAGAQWPLVRWGMGHASLTDLASGSQRLLTASVQVAAGSGGATTAAPPAGAAGPLMAALRRRGGAVFTLRRHASWQRASGSDVHAATAAEVHVFLASRPERSGAQAAEEWSIAEELRRWAGDLHLEACGAASPLWGTPSSEQADRAPFVKHALAALSATRARIPAIALLADPVALAARGRIDRTITGTGLHRSLVDEVAVAVQPGQRCVVTLVQRLDATTYYDLDEVRKAEREGGARLRAFAKFIDVERPTSASTQHLVLLRAPLNGSLDRGVASAQLPALLHVRYQAVGCGDAPPDRRALHPGSHTPWPTVVAERLGVAVHPDGSFRWDAAAREGGGGGVPVADVTPSLPPSFVWPRFSGCYALAFLPPPTVYVRCTGEGEASGWLPLTSGLSDDDARPQAAAGHSPEASRAAADSPGGSGRDSLVWQHLGRGRLLTLMSPVPVGERSHGGHVAALTAAAALGGASAVLLAAWFSLARSAVAARGTKAD